MQAAVFIENGVFAIQPLGQPKMKLWAESDHKFSILEAEATIEFPKGAVDAAVDQFILEQGRSFSFKRLN